LKPELEKLVKILKRKPVSAVELSDALGCCRPTVYARLNALQKLGYRVEVSKSQKKQTGPVAQLFSL